MRMGRNLWWLLVTVDHCSDADHEILYRQRPDTDARCPHREGISLNERQPVVVSVTVDSAPVKWAREGSRRPPRDGANQLHQTEHYRVISRAVKFHLGRCWLARLRWLCVGDACHLVHVAEDGSSNQRGDRTTPGTPTDCVARTRMLARYYLRAGSNRRRARKMLVDGSERIASFIPTR